MIGHEGLGMVGGRLVHALHRRQIVITLTATPKSGPANCAANR